MKLYFTPGTCALADHIVLDLDRQAVRSRRTSRAKSAQQPWFLKLNPGRRGAGARGGRLGADAERRDPQLSRRQFPEAKLGGDGTPKGRAEVNRWLAFVNSDVHPAFKPLFGATAYLEDPALIEKTKDERARNAAQAVRTRRCAARRTRLGRRHALDRRSVSFRDAALGEGCRTSICRGLDNLARLHAAHERRCRREQGARGAGSGA